MSEEATAVLQRVRALLSGSLDEPGIQAWWHQRRVDLDGMSPAQAWATDPEAVLALAEMLPRAN